MLSEILSTFPILTTKRLLLRQPLERDAKQLFLLRSDTMVNKYLDRQQSTTVEEVLSFIRKVNENFKNNSDLYWVIAQTNDENLIGTICLFDFSTDFKKCEIGYELFPGYQGQGLMNEALEKVVAFAFQILQLEKIDAFIHKDNQRSIKLLQKFGFRKATVIDENNPTNFYYLINT